MKRAMVLGAAMLLVSYSAAKAQDADIAAGAAYAEEVCAACHAVLANENMSPLPQAPTFQSVADTPGMTEMALTVWMQSSHPTMPNIILKSDELRNVVAYIRSLDRKK
jgi:mono/diheme cytochrome c family protein